MGIAAAVSLLEQAEGQHRAKGGPARREGAEDVPAAPPLGGPPTPDGGNAIRTALGAVSDYIPTEALALYVAVAAIFNAPEGARDFKLALFFGGLAFVLLFTLFSFKDWPLRFRSRVALRHLVATYLRRLLTIAFGLLAFWLWVGAMPGSPFAGEIKYLDFVTDTTVGYGAAVVLAAVALPTGARFFGLKPR